MTLEEKLNLWVKLTGVDPSIEEKSIVFRMDGKLSRWDIEKMNERIKEALTFDQNGMFADAYLGVYFDQFIKDQELTLDKLLMDPEVESYLHDARTLYQASYGLYRPQGPGAAQLYVSRGIGMSGVPFRFLAPPELVVLG